MVQPDTFNQHHKTVRTVPACDPGFRGIFRHYRLSLFLMTLRQEGEFQVLAEVMLTALSESVYIDPGHQEAAKTPAGGSPKTRGW